MPNPYISVIEITSATHIDICTGHCCTDTRHHDSCITYTYKNPVGSHY